MYEVYVIAARRSDGQIPSAPKFLDERFWISRQEADDALAWRRDKDPELYSHFDVFTVTIG